MDNCCKNRYDVARHDEDDGDYNRGGDDDAAADDDDDEEEDDEDDDDDDDEDNVSFVVFRFAIKVNVWAIGRDTKECNWNSGAISFNRCNALIRSHEIEIEMALGFCFFSDWFLAEKRL